MMSLTRTRGPSAESRRGGLLGVAEHEVDLGHGGEAGRVDLGGAAGDDQPGAGPLARALRIAWRAWRTASPVTAQVLNTTASRTPSAAACPGWPGTRRR